jgi:hypothetical protein
VKKYHSYLAGNRFLLRVDSEAIRWLKTYSMDEGIIGRWITTLGNYNMEIEHRKRERHFNADALSKKTEFYEAREERLGNQDSIKPGFTFLKLNVYDGLETMDHLDNFGNLKADKIPKGKPPKILKREQATNTSLEEFCIERPTTDAAVQVEELGSISKLRSQTARADTSKQETSRSAEELDISKLRSQTARADTSKQETSRPAEELEWIKRFDDYTKYKRQYEQEYQYFTDLNKDVRPLRYIETHLLSKRDNIAHCISVDAYMRIGIAFQLATGIPGLKEYCLMNQSEKGETIAFRQEEQDRWIYNLVTKEHYYDKPHYEDVERALENMRLIMSKQGMTTVTVPKIACGIDGLSWPIIEDTIKRVFHQTDVEVTVCVRPKLEEESKKAITKFKEQFENKNESKPNLVPDLNIVERHALKAISGTWQELIEFPNTIIEESTPDKRTPARMCATRLRKGTDQEEIKANQYVNVLKDMCQTDYSINDLRRAQRTDLMTNALKHCVIHGELDKDQYDADIKKLVMDFFNAHKAELLINKEDILICKRKPKEEVQFEFDAIVLPQLYQTEALYRAHDQQAHQGMEKVTHRIRQRFV